VHGTTFATFRGSFKTPGDFENLSITGIVERVKATQET
jgi:hypothetical protein